MGIGEIGFLTLVVVAVAGTLVFRSWDLRHQRRLIARWAALRDWRYAERDDTWVDRWRGYPFDRGHTTRAENVMTGPFGPYQAVVFDYRFRKDDFGSRYPTIERFGVHALALPARLPWVHIAAEGYTQKAAKLLGRQDIELESEEFNRAYLVQSEDPKFAVDLLNARTMDLLLRCGGPDVRVEGGYIVLVTDGFVDLSAVDAALVVLATMCEQLPSFVWTDRRVSPPRRLGSSR